MSTTMNDTETMTCEVCEREFYEDEGRYHDEAGIFECDGCMADHAAGALWYFRGLVAEGYTREQVILLARNV